ncbi:hypothetical protein SDC9_182259 [bioreactor metagenome]|uniref:Uncharacterized protein n=1 Tax=bioreactor metagenome TaxID=1076179 RepID=A0A645H6Z5_9ZZZZ
MRHHVSAWQVRNGSQTHGWTQVVREDEECPYIRSGSAVQNNAVHDSGHREFAHTVPNISSRIVVGLKIRCFFDHCVI